MANFQNYSALVDWSKAVTPRVWTARFKLENPPAMDFLAGQYCSFRVQDKLRRTFSIATSPEQKDSFEICADVSPMGLGSKWVMNLKPGDKVDFMGPLGKFILDADSPRKRVFIATGTGIAPVRAMLYESLTKQQDQDVFIFWGLRYEGDLFWNDEFTELSKKFSHFHYILTLSRPADEWQGKKGYAQEHVPELGELRNYDYYLCGNHETIDKIKEFLLAKNIPLEQIKTELFH